MDYLLDSSYKALLNLTIFTMCIEYVASISGLDFYDALLDAYIEETSSGDGGVDNHDW